MSKISLNKGTFVSVNSEVYEIINAIDIKSVLARNIGTGASEILQISKLSAYYGNNSENSIKVSNFVPECFSDEEMDIANYRKNIIEPLLIGERKRSDVVSISEKHELHYTTVYRWLKLYEESELLSSLIPKHSLKGTKGHVRIREETELIVTKTIDDLYLSKQKLTVSRVYTEISRKCHNAGLVAPHENTVRNRINAIKKRTSLAARESRRTADRKYRNTDGVFPEGLYPLDVIQIDHTPVDLIIVDEQYRKPIGRPFLTVAIDVYSRMIMGFYISLEEPSYFSVSQCLSHAILTKDKYLRQIGVDGDWNIWGIPRTIHMDNAQEFRGVELKRVCDQYGITIAWRPVARPQFGGHVERLVGTVMREVHVIPGTTFSNIQERGEYKSDKESVMTIHEFEKYLTEFIVNVYHKRVHHGIGMVPEKRYELGIFGDENTPGRGLPDKIDDEEKFRVSLLPSIERTIQRSGVKINRISYYSDVLRRWILELDENKNKNKKFLFKRDPRDISIIWFFDPEIKDYFPIPYRNISFPPISMWDLRAIQRYLDEKHLPSNTEDQLFAAYARMQVMIEDSSEKTKSVRRKKSSKKSMVERKAQSFPDGELFSNKISDAKESSFDELFNDVQPFEGLVVNTKK